MPEFTYAVTQNVHYYRGVELDEPDDIVDLFENGEWDDSKNEVKWDRVQVYDLEGKQVFDSGRPPVTVWTLVVDGYGGPVTTMVFGSEKECYDALRERYLVDALEADTQEEAEERAAAMSDAEVLDYLTNDPGGFSIYMDPHDVVPT